MTRKELRRMIKDMIDTELQEFVTDSFVPGDDPPIDGVLPDDPPRMAETPTERLRIPVVQMPYPWRPPQHFPVVIRRPTPEHTTWTAEDDVETRVPVVKECGFVSRAPVWLTPAAYEKIAALMDQFPSHEWLAYLQADATGALAELVVPLQEASVGTVHVTTPPDANVKIDGVIHSHHTMRAFHSGTDDDHLVRNHPVSVVVARDGTGALSFEAVRNVVLPCGSRIEVKVPVQIDGAGAADWAATVGQRVTTSQGSVYASIFEGI